MLPRVSVRWLLPEERLTVGTEGALVCLFHDPDVGDDTIAALDALIAHTDSASSIVVLGLPSGRDIDAAGDVSALTGPPGHAVALAAAMAAPADVVFISTACRVPPNWLPRLRAAALSGDTVATSTPLTSAGGAATVAAHGQPDPDGVVAAAAIRSYPRVQIGGPDCLYVRRRTIDLIGGLPTVGMDAGGLGGLAAGLCAAATAAGLVNVVDDDLYVTAAPAGKAGDSLPADIARMAAVDRNDESGRLVRTRVLSDAALGGLTITIDARSLTSAVGGTQRYTLELLLALAGHTDAAVRAVIAQDLAAEAREALTEARVELVAYEKAAAGVAASHVVHRPQQVFSAEDLNLLRLLGRRLVVTHQDLIAFHNPTYHRDADTWEQYRRVTRNALSVADRVVLFSEHSRSEVLADDLVPADRCDVIGAALAPRPAPAAALPPGAPVGREFILCLGADYRHKNRLFALRLVRELRARHGWVGVLVLAGGHVPHGSSVAEERELMASDPSFLDAVVDLGAVDEAGRAWLMGHARAVAVPSVVEGFGLVPLEAAEAGLPCLFAAQTSLGEVVSPSLATFTPWDPVRSAAAVMPLLGDGAARDRHVAALRAGAEAWSWEGLAGQLIGTYESALRAPYRAASTDAWQALERERHLAAVDGMHQELLGHVSGRIALASDEGFLTAREQQGLLRVGARPRLARAVLSPLSLLGSIRAPRP
jgi:glycosyltransferase involved in cell wall biosynthesis